MAFQYTWMVVGIVAVVCIIAFWPKKRFIDTLRGKHIFLTGASGGIGIEVAKQALREGAYVTLVARNREKLVKVAMALSKELDYPEERLLVKTADVRDYTAISTVVKESYDWRPIDVLINNAGITKSGYMEDVSAKDIDSIIQTNVLGSMYPWHAILPQLKLRSRDHPISIVFIGSLASLCWLYGNGVYTASKYAIKGIAECLRLELTPYNMRVTLLCPGFVDTTLLDDVENEVELTEGMAVASFYNRKQAISPQLAAKTLMGGIKKGTFLISASLWLGPILVILTRGFAPSESFLRNLIEAIFAGPLRIISYISQALIYWRLKRIHRKHDQPLSRMSTDG